jgi:hypothetical protein
MACQACRTARCLCACDASLLAVLAMHLIAATSLPTEIQLSLPRLRGTGAGYWVRLLVVSSGASVNCFCGCVLWAVDLFDV